MTRTRGQFLTIGEAARASAASGAAADGDRAGPKRGELQDRVARQMQRALMVGQFVPGQRMSIRQLAAQLGTSPMPVREIIGQLTAAGVLEVLPNRSICVARMTEARFSELTQVRLALEGLAASMACASQAPDLAGKLEKINADLLEAIRVRDVLGCLSHNQAFHFTLYAASGAEVLPGMIEALWLRSGPFMYFSLTDPATPWNAERHSEVIGALRAGDPVATRKAIESDIASTATDLLERRNLFHHTEGPLAEFGNGSYCVG